MEWSRWYLVNEGGTSKIKRYRVLDTGKTTWQRYPAKEYRGLPTPDLEALLRRINATYEVDRAAAEARYNFDHAYINQTSVEAFEKRVRKQSSEPSHVGSVLQMLREYVFEYFVIHNEIPDPSRWHLKEDAWGTWLLTQDLSASTLRKVVGIANRFNTFLVESVYPDMQTPRKLDPIGKKKLQDLEDGALVGTKYIQAATYQAILKHAETVAPDILPNLRLCYDLGLRISETLGLSKEKLFVDHVLVDEQGARLLNGKVVRKKVKTRDQRMVPYWNTTAKATWANVKAVVPMHPNTLTKRVNACLAEFEHTSHDFRRTFITNALRKYHWKDVMKAAGHKDVRTTLSYDQDDRGLTSKLADLGDDD